MLGFTSPPMVPFMFGVGSSKLVGGKAKELGMTKVIVVTDKVLVQIGIVAPIIASLEAAGIPTILYDGVVPDPTDVCVDEGAKIALEAGVDGVVAIGGGSSMDAGKCINVLLNNPMPIRRHFVPNMPIPVNHPMITIPTTAGSGAECTAGAIITDTELHVKIPVAMCGVSYIFVDPELYVGMPLKPSIFAGFDALTHAMDIMTCNNCEEMSRVLCEKAVRIIVKALPKVAENPKDIDARSDMALAATLAGQALGSYSNSTHYSHSIGHSLGAALHMQHGYACGVAVPQILERLASIDPEDTRLFCDCMNFNLDESLDDEEYGEAAKIAMQGFMAKIGMPNMKDMGYNLDEILATIPMIITDIITVFSWPAQLDPSDFVEILTEAYDQ